MEAAMGKITTMIKSKLHGLKDKAKKEGMKNVMKYKDKLPTEDQIAEKLKSSSCNPSDKKRLENKYNKIKNALKKIQKMLAAAGLAIAGLSALLKMLNGLLKILDAIIKILNVILKVLKIIIKIAKIVVKFLGGTGTGGLIDILSRLIVKADYKIKNWVQAVGRAKEFIKKMLKKYINPITRILDKAAAIIAKVVGVLEGLILILELIYMLALSKCTMSDGDGGTNADTNNRGDGTAGGGTGAGDTGGSGGSGGSGGFGSGTEGDKMEAIYRMLEETGSPEEVMARMIRMGGDDEYIRYIRNANFETIGYERFNAAIDSRDITAGVDYPSIDNKRNKHIDTSIEEDDDLDFPDLVRGNAKKNIFRKNLRINPKGPQPSDENEGFY